MKRRFITLICGLLLSALCFAQLPMSIEKGIEYQPNDVEQKVYSQVKDMNDHLCALIKVSLTSPLPYPLVLEVGGLGVTKVEEQKSGEIWCFVPYQVKNLEFKCKGYTPIPKIPVNLKEGGVYTLTIRVDASTTTITNIKATSGYLKIRLNPADAFISIGKTRDYEMGLLSVKNGLFAKSLNFGTWYYKVESDLYKTYEGEVDFNSKTPTLEVNLEPDYSYLSINTEPEGAEIYIDNKFVGNSPLNLDQKYKNGSYSLRLIKEDYYSESLKINLNENGDRKSFSYKLKAQFGIAECICDDPQAEIWIDDQYKGIGRWKGNVGSSSTHILESRKAGHRSQSVSLVVGENESIQTKVAAPLPLYGLLSIETEPMECEVYVDGKKLGESPLQLELLACEHSIKLVKDDYMPIEDKILLTHNQQLHYQRTFTEMPRQELIQVSDRQLLPASNCFIVSQSGTYSFAPVKGNSDESVGQVSSVEVLWETFGTDVKPNVGDLIQDVVYREGIIEFSTAKPFREGNALIAAKDAKGTILWSWHIWMTDQPEEQVYYNNAGIMMDRNLGATSATPGDVGALGLLYQWGRKDPFFGPSSIKSNKKAKATNSFPKSVISNKNTGTIAYATSHPTIFIANSKNFSNDDWQIDNENTRWQPKKTIYDPCPAGWRVPDGGDKGVWSKALNTSSRYSHSYNITCIGMNFSYDFGSESMIWYPSSGTYSRATGLLEDVGYIAYYWTVTPNGKYAYCLKFLRNCDVYPLASGYRANGQAVRCQKE